MDPRGIGSLVAELYQGTNPPRPIFYVHSKPKPQQIKLNRTFVQDIYCDEHDYKLVCQVSR
jgi:hypothetical protein